VVFNNLLDLSLKFRCYAAGLNLLEEFTLGSKVGTEFSFPLGDLVDGDGVKLKRN